ncbi:MAG: 2-octaprenyl-6-methoxyphenyl hydroxylase [Stappia sp.]|uniref:UbiH/UbiF family hydroxylase n=1 Tax=Stappia sp. TaxID=1870903 RepID=UPI000C3842B2|nr:UbiH/UbiF family hydroxylase [Stappia sp.]MBM22609.1 2-octaprenyl-6-methoxyphenyl hydroxylase [Stappia sp.]
MTSTSDARAAGTATSVHDVAVVGAGPSGLAMAIALARSGLFTVLIAPDVTAEDDRTTALLDSSVEMLKSLDLWERILPHAAPLAHMRIIDGTERLFRAPETVFDASELKLEAFGYNIRNRDLNRILGEAASGTEGLTRIHARFEGLEAGADCTRLDLETGEHVCVRLVVGADGRNSPVRDAVGIDTKTWRYPQAALIVNLDHDLPHRFHSTEFHTPTGPFTLVPLSGRGSSLVCVERPEVAQELAAMDDDTLALELERRARSVYGKMRIDGARQVYPLGGLTATRMGARRAALVGEAAHVFPPIGAQGLNLGLRDVAALVEIVVSARDRGEDIGSDEVLGRYERQRRADITSRTTAVDLLNRSLLTDMLPVQALRSIGLYLASRVAPLRRMLMREGIAPVLARPKLMRGLTLGR